MAQEQESQSPVMVLRVPYEHGRKTWVARISGKCKKYGLRREFAPAVGKKAGETEYVCLVGFLYEVCSNDERFFIEACTDGPKMLTTEQAAAAIQKLDDGRQARIRKIRKARKAKERRLNNQLDSQIARINNEGGFNLGISEN